jgi:hypothetical protein
MTRGVLIFAQNNADVDYTKLAIFTAERVQKFLNVPVSLVTDNKDYLFKTHGKKAKVFDHVIDTETKKIQNKRFYDGSISSKVLLWKNFSRSDCFELTPYDETLVIDADYIVSSDHINKVWGSPHDLMLYRDAYDLAHWRDISAFKYLNQYSIPFYWATVFYFKKTEETSAFFKIIQHIRENWYYYRLLYSIDSTMFRNDFAFSMAIHIMNNSLDADFIAPIPGKLYYTLDRDLLLNSNDTELTFLLEKQSYNGEYTAMKVRNLDVHIMNKYSLSRCIDEQ